MEETGFARQHYLHLVHETRKKCKCFFAWISGPQAGGGKQAVLQGDPMMGVTCQKGGGFVRV